MGPSWEEGHPGVPYVIVSSETDVLKMILESLHWGGAVRYLGRTSVKTAYIVVLISYQCRLYSDGPTI